MDMPGWDFRNGYDRIHQLFEAHPDTTAVFVSTLVMAVGAIRGCLARACPCPRTSPLVALHDSELASYLNPPLTTVSLPVRQMGSEAVDLLANLSRAASRARSSSTASRY